MTRTLNPTPTGDPPVTDLRVELAAFAAAARTAAGSARDFAPTSRMPQEMTMPEQPPVVDPQEPDNPAAYALAKHIADHPIGTVQAAFRYLNTELTLEARDQTAVLPAPADRPAVLLWAADAIDAETRLAKERQILEPDKFRPCRDASAQLRRLADEAQQPEAEAHRTRTEWIAEVLEDDGMWMYLGTGPDRSVAERRRASVTRRHPGAETRTVRKTTTYTVAADEGPQPASADRGTAAAIDETAATIQAEGVGQ